MAFVENIQLGAITAINQNQVYALPAARVLLFTEATTPTLQQSNDVTFAASTAITLTGGQAELAGAFLRCTSAGPINVIVKAGSTG